MKTGGHVLKTTACASALMFANVGAALVLVLSTIQVVYTEAKNHVS